MNFTDGKHLHMVGAYSCLMVQTPANQRYLWLVPLRHHPNRARDSLPPSRLLTHISPWARAALAERFEALWSLADLAGDAETAQREAEYWLREAGAEAARWLLSTRGWRRPS